MTNQIRNKNNIKNGDLVVCDNTFSFMLDIRGSTSLNDSIEVKNLLKIYKTFLNDSYNAFKNNGFEYIEIQDDGILALIGSVDFKDNIKKCISDIEDIMNKLFNDYKIKTTLSIRFGKEYYSCFGGYR